MRALGLLITVGACASGCAGDAETQPPVPAAAGETTGAAATNAATTDAEDPTATEPEDGRPHQHAAWSRNQLHQRLAGTAIVVEERRVRLNAGTLTCGGEGASGRRGGQRVWSHFSCIQPTFPPGQLVGPDALFRVHVTGAQSYLVTDTSFSNY